MNTYISSVMTYGLETMSLSKISKLIMNNIRSNKKNYHCDLLRRPQKNDEIRSRTKVEDVITAVAWAKWT